MAEITQDRIEDAIEGANDFLATERGVSLDGDYASAHVAKYALSVEERADALLLGRPDLKQSGYYNVLDKANANYFAEASVVLPTSYVLLPWITAGNSVYYPAVVSEDGIASGNIRLHVLAQQYRQKVRYGASLILSAAGQSETTGVGAHGHNSGDGLEAEHFATLLAAGSDARVQAAWQAGDHINHHWRKKPGNSVTTQVSKRLFGNEIPQATVTITPEHIIEGKTELLWHEGMRDPETGKPLRATRQNALVVVQGLGFEALRQQNPNGIEVVKRLIT